MKYNELEITTKKTRTRVGRGISAGKGKTAGRGTKGQKARKSGGVRPGFEGGQNPLTQRIPKLRGFRSIRAKAEIVYTGQLGGVKGTVDNFSLADAGLITSPYNRVKVVVRGELKDKVTVKLQGASAEAVKAIKKAGGSFDIVERPKRTAKEKAEKAKK
jgi:large subunit ribosomal protein L15